MDRSLFTEDDTHYLLRFMKRGNFKSNDTLDYFIASIDKTLVVFKSFWIILCESKWLRLLDRDYT